MIELHFDLKFRTEPWKKALAFSFIYYLLVYFLLVVIVTVLNKDINLKIVSMISITYFAALTLGFRHMYKLFKSKYSRGLEATS
jgi:hypothetical protein